MIAWHLLRLFRFFCFRIFRLCLFSRCEQKAKPGRLTPSSPLFAFFRLCLFQGAKKAKHDMLAPFSLFSHVLYFFVFDICIFRILVFLIFSMLVQSLS